ncbi:MAG: hypothetical protein DLM60_22295 [Pseudonocardiales bacterium]|nr:MAG: hypothetical protein DLM60_22295 [Pseudonocardiales bacterium]
MDTKARCGLIRDHGCHTAHHPAAEFASRSVRNLIDLSATLAERRVDLRVLQGIDEHARRQADVAHPRCLAEFEPSAAAPRHLRGEVRRR